MPAPPRPTQQTIAMGNPGHRSLDLSVQSQPNFVEPPKPSWLSEKAGIEWDRISPVLVRNKLLTEADGEPFGFFCTAVARLAEAEIEMRNESLVIETLHGGKMKNPLLNVIKECGAEIFKYSLQFGLTPAARTKIKFEKGTFPGAYGWKDPKEREKEEFKEAQKRAREERGLKMVG